MINQQHPISVPQELLNQWCRWEPKQTVDGLWRKIADNSAQWGADQELEACHCEVSFWGGKGIADRLQATRRPKPPSLKEQALERLMNLEQGTNPPGFNDYDTIRRALEALPND